MAWQIEFDPDALKDLRKLDQPIQIRLVGFLRTRVSSLTNPRDIGEGAWAVTGNTAWVTGASSVTSRTRKS